MELREVHAPLAAVAWTGVTALALARALTGAPGLTVWAVLVGQLAVLLTGWIIVEHVAERLERDSMRRHQELDERMVERVANRLADVLRDQNNVSSLR